MPEKESVAVIGGGSWATALVKILSNNVSGIHWWLRNPDHVEFIKKYHHNPGYLSDVELDVQNLMITSDIKTAIKNSSMVILAVPSAFLKQALTDVSPDVLKRKIIFSAIKGIVPEHNKIVGEFIHEQFQIPFEYIGVITGPCHAEEVAMEKLSYLTVACQDITNASKAAQLLNCRYIKTIVSDDIFGTEYAAVLKNIIAIASGICHSLGYGDNFHAVLIASASREIKRFIDAVHPIKRDINDSAYLGDLLVTAYSQFSRNRTFGSMIGKGYSVKTAQMEMNMIAEGYYASSCIHEINKKYKVDLPICNAVYSIIHEKISPKAEMKLLSEKLS